MSGGRYLSWMRRKCIPLLLVFNEDFVAWRDLKDLLEALTVGRWWCTAETMVLFGICIFSRNSSRKRKSSKKFAVSFRDCVYCC